MSSRSPSTVISAVSRMAEQSTQLAAMHHRAVGQRVILEHGLDRLQVELGRAGP